MGEPAIVPGQRFGQLTVLEEAPRRGGRRCWLCRCDCGQEKVIDQGHLRAGHTQSCGCILRERGKARAADLTGRRFGRLTAREPVEARSGNGVFWRCRCDCGKETLLRSDALTRGHTRSCGCLREDTGRNTLKNSLHFVDGTCIEHIANQRERSVNRSGHRGVCQRKNGRWEAYLTFQRKRHYLGQYPSFEEAVKARLKGEERYEDFINKLHKERFCNEK